MDNIQMNEDTTAISKPQQTSMSSKSLALAPRGFPTSVASNTSRPDFTAMSNTELHTHIGKSVGKCKGHYDAFCKEATGSL